MNKRLLAAALALAICGSAQAVDLQLKNADAPGVGLNESTPATPVGGNTATTLGAQRQRVYDYALGIWSSVLGTNAPVVVEASFPALACTATGAVLGSAGPIWAANDGVVYIHASLTNAIVGGDLNPYQNEIRARFNPNLGAPNCLAGSGWYYGLDGNTPAGKINFLNVVMHEVGHGLGVSGFLDKETGAFADLGSGVLPDVYSVWAYDNITGKSFVDPTTTNAQRAAAIRTVGATVWDGPNVNQQASLFLDGGYQESSLTVTAPAPLARTYGFFGTDSGPAPTATNFNGQWVVATDAADPAGMLTTDGCSTITNVAAITGNIAMISRGTCPYTVKIENAQAAGATAVVILNNAGTWGTMAVGPTVTIPAVMVQQADGAAFQANAPITGGMVDGPVTLAGMDVNGRTRLYSPWIVATGSSFSHFDTALSPNVLMEPFDSPDIQAQLTLDLTPALLKDIGWPMNTGMATMGSPNVLDCETGIPAYEDGGLVPGASVQAAHNVCLNSAKTRSQYSSCMTAEKDRMVDSGLLTYQQGQKVMVCARRVTDRTRFPIAK